MSEVRVRFAPSPTGELHVGGLRTALFNYLLARKHGGRFVLRIEDTDRSRYVAEAERQIIELLEWAGVPPDEAPDRDGPYGPYRQSERLPAYREAAERLLEAGRAYPCYCSAETLEEMRRHQVARGLPTRYDGRCRHLSDGERAGREAEGARPVIRMKIPEPEERIVVRDLIRGAVAFSSAQLDDQVLIKSDGFPTYHLAVVVDDHAMRISHVLRAEEWLPSTPKHLLLYRWLGWEPPEHAHLPLLLNADRSKMSKRKGDVSVDAYREQGYLPDALVNFIALLGWSPGDDQELHTRAELVEKFSLERIGKTGAVFDRDKLDWMNQTYIQALSPEALYERVRPFLAGTPYAGADEATLRKICAVVQPKLVRLTDVTRHLSLFFRPADAPLSPEAAERVRDEAAQRAFRALRQRLEGVAELDTPTFKALMKEVAGETGVKGKALWGPMRAALTLETEGPDLGLIVDVLGKDTIRARLDQALQAA